MVKDENDDWLHRGHLDDNDEWIHERDLDGNDDLIHVSGGPTDVHSSFASCLHLYNFCQFSSISIKYFRVKYLLLQTQTHVKCPQCETKNDLVGVVFHQTVGYVMSFTNSR